jgi:hypothetical protein
MRARWWILISIIVAVVSFSLLYYVINNFWPNPDTVLAQPQLLFLMLIFLGVGAMTIPISAIFNHRFARAGWLERDKTRLIRQGTWVGFFTILVAYLQLLRALNWTIVAVLAGVFILIETFFLTRS